MKKVKFTSLNTYNSLEELLRSGLLFSRAFLKKKLPKKILNKEVDEKSEVELDLDVLNRNLINPIYTGEKIEVLSEDEDFIVLSKPEGLHGHPLKYSETNTVLNFLRKNYSNSFLGIPSENQERGLLYRLDELTSGVLIYVKNEKLHTELREKFSTLMKKKVYVAVVEGKANKSDQLKHFFDDSGPKGQKRKLNSDSGKECGELSYELVEYDESMDLSLIKIELKEGLRHQIRAQLSHVGLPILGDKLYGGSDGERLYLHAYEYSFSHNEKEYSYKSEFNFLNFNCRL